MDANRPRAYSYIRFSSAEQAHGSSLDRQLERSQEYAAENNLHLDESLTFSDLGVSGFDASNLAPGAELAEFLKLVRAKEVPRGSYLLIESLDRLSRATISVAMRLLLELLEEGIIVVTLIDKQRYEQTNTSTDFQQLIVSLSIFFRANDESLHKVDRGRKAWVKKRQNADTLRMTEICPAWLRLADDRKTYELIPEKVDLVREIIRRTQDGEGRRAIATDFNSRNIPTIALKRTRRNDKNEKKKKKTVDKTNPQRLWHESYIAKMLANRALVGEFQPHKLQKPEDRPGKGKRVPEGLPVANYFPALIDEDEFALLQAEIKGRRTAGGRRGLGFSNLFTGLVRCAYCQRTMTYVNKGEDQRGNRDNRRGKYLICTTAHRGKGCFKLPWVYHEFEDSFFELATKANFADFVSRSNDRKAALRSIRGQLTVLEAALKTNREIQERATGLMLLPNADKAQVLLDRIINLQEEGKDLEEQYQSLREQLVLEEQKSSQVEETLAALHEVRQEVANKTGAEAYPYRLRLNQHLRRIIDYIVLSPGGFLYPEGATTTVRENLKIRGFPIHEIERIVSSMPTQPNTEQRMFFIVTRGEILQAIQPAADIPDFEQGLKAIVDAFEAKGGLSWSD